MGLCWIDHFETGILRLDCDHRSIIRATAMLREALENGLANNAAVLARMLARLVEAHFRREDGLFTRAGYPRQDEHNSGHIVGRAHLMPVLAAAADGDLGRSLDRLGHFEAWLVSEILESDLAFASYVDYFDLIDALEPMG